jgi:tripartite-type tricarboxylate transporter receptor subunit TctC
VRDALAKQGVELFYMDSKELAGFLHSEAARFAGLLKHARVKTPQE